jgi:hypothetical protein
MNLLTILINLEGLKAVAFTEVLVVYIAVC